MTVDFFGITKFCTLLLVLWSCDFKTGKINSSDIQGLYFVKNIENIVQPRVQPELFCSVLDIQKLNSLKSSSLIWYMIFYSN